ncbi:MAG: pilin [Candidatus Pacebacteria bacterium]|nr:pilin [Candidatus Paceibacterota bacterium]
MAKIRKIFSFFAIIACISIMAFGVVGVAKAQPQVLKECLTIRQSFKLTITSSATDDTQPITFYSGNIIASKALNAGPSCLDKNGAQVAVSAKCQQSEIKSDGTGVCYLVAGQKEYGLVGMFNILYNVTNWVFFIMTIAAVLMIVFGGFTYITAAGDPTKAEKGKGILTFAIIGLAIALIAKLIPSLVRFILRV